MVVNGDHQLFGYQHYSKGLILGSSKYLKNVGNQTVLVPIGFHYTVCLLNILKNVGYQTALAPIGFHYMDIKYNGSQWEPNLFGYQHFSKISLFVFF